MPLRTDAIFFWHLSSANCNLDISLTLQLLTIAFWIRERADSSSWPQEETLPFPSPEPTGGWRGVFAQGHNTWKDELTLEPAPGQCNLRARRREPGGNKQRLSLLYVAHANTETTWALPVVGLRIERVYKLTLRGGHVYPAPTLYQAVLPTPLICTLNCIWMENLFACSICSGFKSHILIYSLFEAYNQN